ncbi:MAG: lysozyme inhibitor LprI family protein [Shewanella sp.]
MKQWRVIKVVLVTKMMLVSTFALFTSGVFANDATLNHTKAVDCDQAYSTIEINECAALTLAKAQAQLTEYLAASLTHNADDTELVAVINTAQQTWQQYMTAQCDAIYTQWRDGSIRGLMALSCKTKLTQLRTHEIWENWLTYMDSTPPVLPEPTLTTINNQ